MDTFFSILTSIVDDAARPATAGIAIAVIGLNIHFGLTGLINFGQAGFMLLGAYGFAISLRDGLPIWLAVIVGLAAALVFALILGIPTLQLRGDYLAIVTISAAEIIRYAGRLAQLEEFTGAAQGIGAREYNAKFIELSPFSKDTSDTFSLMPVNYTDIADGAMWVRVVSFLVFLAIIVAILLIVRRARAQLPAIAEASGASGASGPTVDSIDDLAPAERRLDGRTVALISALGVLAVAVLFFTAPLRFPQTGANGWWARLVSWLLVGVCAIVLLLLSRSPWGRALRGVREDENAIRSLGKNVFALKMQALVIGGLFGAMGGIVYVIASNVQPDNLGRQATFICYTALLLGGLATVFGPVLGTVLYFTGRGLIRGVGDAMPDSIMNTSEADQFAFIIVGVALMLLVIFRPQGILGNKKEVSVHV